MSRNNLPIPNKIPMDQFIDRCFKFFNEVKDTDINISAQHNNELHDLHNDQIAPQENRNTGCQACRMRAFNNLKNYYENLIKTTNINNGE